MDGWASLCLSTGRVSEKLRVHQKKAVIMTAFFRFNLYLRGLFPAADLIQSCVAFCRFFADQAADEAYFLFYRGHACWSAAFDGAEL